MVLTWSASWLPEVICIARDPCEHELSRLRRRNTTGLLSAQHARRRASPSQIEAIELHHRSEERRVGKERRSRRAREFEKKPIGIFSSRPAGHARAYALPK